ncbi:Ran-specific GTPase-activating protein 1 [Termitomyces sp. J132]|nr:Ran-specific GTPase-activating protein 1 [Termitomyces sp. J132]
MEEDEEVLFKMCVDLKSTRFLLQSILLTRRFERGTGDVRLLSHKETRKVRLVMRRDKTLKVCANHVNMKLQPNIGSDRSWVWKVAADYSETPPTSETLAIRLANAENANQFKAKFEEAQANNAKLSGGLAPTVEEEAEAGARDGKKNEDPMKEPETVAEPVSKD